MKSPTFTWISRDDPPEAFPDINNAFEEPAGLLAAGGDLSPARLLYAYRHGIFPWYSEGEPILWWSPNPRCVLRPAEFHASRSLHRTLRRTTFEMRYNTDFENVIAACAASRPGQSGTWITREMRNAYVALHRDGWAHSAEVFVDNELAGGVYGIVIGRVFFGESMFTRTSDGSKAALYGLCRHLVEAGFELLDCQVESPHVLSLGAVLMPRREFSALLDSACASQARYGGWPREPYVL